MWNHFQYLDFNTYWMVFKEPNFHIFTICIFVPKILNAMKF
jgi:hypothetical protein